jgi:LAGLIDADG endonuclease
MDLRAYFAGFVDGEGCFTVSFSPRSKLLIGWEVRPTDRSGKTLKYEVRCLDDLVERIIPFFEANPLLSSKQRDFERFAEVCRLVRNQAHRTEPGLREIVGLALAMNASGKRKFAMEAIFPQELKL